MDDLAQLEGKNLQGYLNYEQKIILKNAARKKELEQKALLEKEAIDGTREGGPNNKYQKLFKFAIDLGSDNTLEKSLPEVRLNLITVQVYWPRTVH